VCDREPLRNRIGIGSPDIEGAEDLIRAGVLHHAGEVRIASLGKILVGDVFCVAKPAVALAEIIDGKRTGPGEGEQIEAGDRIRVNPRPSCSS
jgi:hypothetical protein